MGICKATNPSTNNARRKYDLITPETTPPHLLLFSCAAQKSQFRSVWLDNRIFGSFEATEQSHNNNLTYIIPLQHIQGHVLQCSLSHADESCDNWEGLEFRAIERK